MDKLIFICYGSNKKIIGKAIKGFDKAKKFCKKTPVEYIEVFNEKSKLIDEGSPDVFFNEI